MTFDFIEPLQKTFTATLRPEQEFTIAPNVFVDRLHAYLRAQRPDSRSTDVYAPIKDAPPPPTLLFRFGYFTLLLRPEYYLDEVGSAL